MRRLRSLLSLLLISTMLLSTASSLYANEEKEIWINDRGNVEMYQEFYLDLINEIKYNAEMVDRLWGVIHSEREAHDREREAQEKEREQWQKLEDEMNEYSRMQNKNMNYLETKVSNLQMWNKILTIVAVGGIVYGVSQ